MSTTHKNVDLEIVEARWRTTFIVSDPDSGDIIQTYVASADSFYTEGSSIWFGTAQEYEEARAR